MDQMETLPTISRADLGWPTQEIHDHDDNHYHKVTTLSCGRFYTHLLAAVIDV